MKTSTKKNSTHRLFEPFKELGEQERERIRKDIIEGAKEVNDLYLEESRAWYPLEEEVRLKFEAGLYDDPIMPQNPSA